MSCKSILLQQSIFSFKILITFQHTVLILPHVCYEDLVSIVHYVYTGDVSIASHRLDSFLMTAKSLQLTGVEAPPHEDDSLPQDLSMKSQSKRARLDDFSHCPDSSPPPQTATTPTVETVKPARQYKTSDKQFHQNCKLPNWSQSQLQDAIESVITQKLRFTQASARYGIPKGTLYDNILGKSKRMQVLDQVGLTEAQEMSVLEFCCEISNMPYNRRTSKSLRDIMRFVTDLKHRDDAEFRLSTRQGFKWWWAFTKKHNVISLYYQETEKEEKEQTRHDASPDNLLNLLNSPSSVQMNFKKFSFLPFLGLNTYSTRTPGIRSKRIPIT